MAFLSTLSLRRATRIDPDQVPGYTISIHALLAESDDFNKAVKQLAKEFLSTLSLRRATSRYLKRDFAQSISIHALLAESDTIFAVRPYDAPIFLSTLSLRRATRGLSTPRMDRRYFYPRSPCGERPRSAGPLQAECTDFYPRSPCGERLGAVLVFNG